MNRAKIDRLITAFRAVRSISRNADRDESISTRNEARLAIDDLVDDQRPGIPVWRVEWADWDIDRQIGRMEPILPSISDLWISRGLAGSRMWCVATEEDAVLFRMAMMATTG